MIVFNNNVKLRQLFFIIQCNVKIGGAAHSDGRNLEVGNKTKRFRMRSVLIYILISQIIFICMTMRIEFSIWGRAKQVILI